MNDNNLLIHLSPTQGYNKVFELGQFNMALTRFGIVQLAKGSSYTGNTGKFEMAIITLGGKFSAKGDNWEFAEIGGRKDVFSGKINNARCELCPWVRTLIYFLKSLS